MYKNDRETKDPHPGVRTSPAGKALYAVVDLLVRHNRDEPTPEDFERAAERCSEAGYPSCAALLRTRAKPSEEV